MKRIPKSEEYLYKHPNAAMVVFQKKLVFLFQQFVMLQKTFDYINDSLFVECGCGVSIKTGHFVKNVRPIIY